MSKTFLRSNGDIAAVLRTMIGAPEFSASATKKFKDPVRYVMSAMRLAYEDKVILNTQPVQNWLNRLAEGLYNYQTPDGYPLVSSAWDGPGQIETRFEIARQIGSGSAGLFKPDMPGAADSPPSRKLRTRFISTACSRHCGRRPAPLSTKRNRRRIGTSCFCRRRIL